MVRYLLIRHPVACCVALLAAVMMALRYAVFPPIVQNFGFVGFAIALAAIFLMAFMLDRRD